MITSDSIKEFLEVGADYVLPKPLEARELNRIMIDKIFLSVKSSEENASMEEIA